MAVFSVPPARLRLSRSASPSVRRCARTVWRPAQTLSHIFAGPLPHDALSDEVTVNLLFRGSLALNFLTGGAPDMTFSARCHRGRATARRWHTRAAWQVIAAKIDFACAVLRGETHHCATAWDNHISRRKVDHHLS